MERNDIENIKSNQSKQRSYRGAKRSGRGGAHGGAPALHPSRIFGTGKEIPIFYFSENIYLVI